MLNKSLSFANACPARERPGDDNEDDPNKADVDNDDASELARDDLAAAPPRPPLYLALHRFGAAQQWWGSASGRPCAREQTGKEKMKKKERQGKTRKETKQKTTDRNRSSSSLHCFLSQP